MWSVIKQVACPALMVRGGASDVVPSEQAERMKEELPQGVRTQPAMQLLVACDL